MTIYRAAPAVFLDWFGTIADPPATSRRYGEVMSRLLHDWYGLSLEDGIRVHDQALEWFMGEWPRRRDATRNYTKSAQEMDIDHIYKVFELYGRPFSGSRNEAHTLARRLTRAVASQIDTVYSDVRPALDDLKRMRCRIFPATGADRNYLEGLMEGSRLAGYFDDIITPEMLNVDKRRPDFWKAILERTKSLPDVSFAVDDDIRILEAAHAVGICSVLIDREYKPEESLPWVTRLQDLSRLPTTISLRMCSNDR